MLEFVKAENFLSQEEMRHIPLKNNRKKARLIDGVRSHATFWNLKSDDVINKGTADQWAATVAWRKREKRRAIRDSTGSAWRARRTAGRRLRQVASGRTNGANLQLTASSWGQMFRWRVCGAAVSRDNQKWKQVTEVIYWMCFKWCAQAQIGLIVKH